MKNAYTTSFIEDEQLEEKQPKSFEVISRHNEQVPIEFETPEV